MMTEDEIKAEIFKAFDLLQKDVYNVQDLQAHILTMIKDKILPDVNFHKDQVERLILDITTVQDLQRKYFNGHKSVLSECKAKEANLEKKCKQLLNKGYSVKRFLENTPKQGDIFS
jgi:hypothetical protein